MTERHDISMDVWRGIAISMVLLLHAYAFTKGTNPNSLYEIIFHNLMFGVNLFFVISGYLISRSFDSSATVGDFFVKRAAKILPLYLIFLHIGILIFVIAVRFVPETTYFRNGITTENLTLSNYVRHLFFLQGFDPRHLNSLLDGSWSIASEVYFYALFPVIRTLVSNMERSLLFCVGAFALQGLTANVVYAFGVRHGYPAYIAYNFLAGLPSFTLGIAIYWFKREGLLGARTPVLFLAFIGFFVAFALSIPEIIGRQSVFMVTVACFIGMTRFKPSAFTNFLATLGQQTYALYFTHITLATWFYNLLLYNTHFGVAWTFLINLAICFPLAFMFSALAFNRIDNYCLNEILGRSR